MAGQGSWARRALCAGVLGAIVLAAPASAKLPSVATGPRPGPNALYASPPRAPQLENKGAWQALPILVSGTQAYRVGEWIYQDYLYDDHGARGSADPDSPWGADAHLFSPPAGTYTYPRNPVYANNAADLVELRVRPGDGATLFRVTLNSLRDPARTGFTIALGDSPAPLPWPRGAGISSPAQLFLTVHGATAELTDAATGAPRGPASSASADLVRRQVEVRVPHAAWNPGTSKVRMTIGVGVWNPAANAYLAPSSGAATETAPGGAGPTRSAIVNVGPRFSEPNPDVNDPAAPWTLGDSAGGSAVQAAWWRESAQADALRLGDASPFRAEVDFAKLAARTRDDSGIPRSGPIDRILASRHQFGQGVDPGKVCFDIGSSFNAGAKCVGRYVGQLQPYALYVPNKPQPRGGWGTTLLLHSLSANYNQYTASRNQSQLGDRGAGSVVITPSGRGPDGFYAGIAEADTFETWADVARHYELDPDWTVVSGYSMGGFGTYRLLARWPDLFARGFSVVGIPGSVDDQLASLRNTPILAWNATADELVRLDQAEETARDLEAAGLRFIYDLFATSDHLTLATNDEYGPGAAWLGGHRVDRSPAHVTYVVDPTEDSEAAATVADHAYWLSGLRVRDPRKSKTGTIDARSLAFGEGDPKPSGVTQSAGTLNGGAHGPMAYAQREQGWGPVPATPKADRLAVTATNIGEATVDARRARLSCAPQLDIRSDGPLNLRLLCPPLRTLRCSRYVLLRLPRIRGRRVVSVVVRHRGRAVRRARRRDILHVAVRRVSTRAFVLRVYMRTNGRGKSVRRVVITRRIARCR